VDFDGTSYSLYFQKRQHPFYLHNPAVKTSTNNISNNITVSSLHNRGKFLMAAPHNKRKSKYPPLHQARATALDLQINSRADYIKWHTDNNITYLPRYPERVYKDWVSWNDYLGTANIFNGELKKKHYRPFWEAVKWSQEFCTLHQIDTAVEWMKYYKEHTDEMPIDIPGRPETIYDEWDGWKTWTGTDVRGRIASAKMDTALLCLANYNSLRMPGNVYAIIHANGGIAELQGVFKENSDLRYCRAYHMENDVKDIVLDLIAKHGTETPDGMFFANVNDVLFELDGMLRVFDPTKVG
jgi:phage tail protein X